MSQTIYLVVGASRGIGREVVNQLSQNPSNHIIATTRTPVDFAKPNVENIILDQTDSESVNKAAAKVKEVDVLLVNAAIGGQEYLLSSSTERMQELVETNVIGVHRVVNAFVPALKARKTRKVVIISSVSGSNAVQKDARIGFQGPYAVTKAANNMQVVQYHNELHGDGFTVVALHPGWVATEMGNAVKGVKNEAMPVPDSARDIIARVGDLTYDQSGSFLVHDGSTLPW